MLTESEITIIWRTILAALLGVFIGWERFVAGAPVRARTIALATMTAAALTAVSGELYPAQAARIVAGIVTGIGFLGAGLIVRSATGEVRGQATAAALWTMSGVGIIVGAGNEVLGIILTFMAYVIISWDEWPIVARLNRWWSKRHMPDTSQPSHEMGKKI